MKNEKQVQNEARKLVREKFRPYDYKTKNIKITSKVEDTTVSYTLPIVDCISLHEVVRVIGELRYHFNRRGIGIYLRGQRKQYGYKQFPSYLRNFVTQDGTFDVQEFKKFHGVYDLFLHETINLLSEYNRIRPILFEDTLDFMVRANIFDLSIETIEKLYEGEQESFQQLLMNKHIVESALQHYGIKTRWIDVTDNINIALFFSVYDLNKECLIITENRKESLYGYVFIYGVYKEQNIGNGLWEGQNQYLARLTEAFSPHASLRPHMQQASLFTDKKLLNISQKQLENLSSVECLKMINFNKYLLCVLRIEKHISLRWLFGSKRKQKKIDSIAQKLVDNMDLIMDKGFHVLDIRTLFPFAFEDLLYKSLLNLNEGISQLKNKFTEINGTKDYFGSIHHYKNKIYHEMYYNTKEKALESVYAQEKHWKDK